MRKDALNGGLHFGFQMCGLSCCLSLRWSLSVCQYTLFPVFTSSLSLFHGAFSITTVLTKTAQNPQKGVEQIQPNNTIDQGRPFDHA